MGKNDIPSVDYYAVLGIGKNAHPEVVKAAYYALVDKVGEEELEAPLSLVKEAFKVLDNSADRAAYDNAKRNQTGKVIGSFKVTEVVYDDGGPTKIYSGSHIITNEPVRIKHGHRISIQNNQMLVEEAKILSKLRHNSILPVQDLLQLEDGSLALVTGDMEGGFTLEYAVSKKGRLEVIDVAWVTERIMNLLTYLNFHGCINGGISPQHILIQQDCHEVAVTDFSLSVLKPGKNSRSKGYIQYFSPPEQVDKTGPLVPESDLFSLGQTMIYALSGGDLDAVRKGLVPSGTPEAMAEFIENLICKDINDRLNWEDKDIFEIFKKVRRMSLGSSRSGMRPIIPE